MAERPQSNFEKTYLAYKNLMYYVAFKILNNVTWAEDVTAEALCKVYQNYHCVQVPVSAQAKRFVVVVTERTAIDYLRKQRHMCALSLDEAVGSTTPDSAGEEALNIRLSFQRLPHDNRTALLLSCYCGLTAKETASVMGFSVSKVERLISRGKEKLRVLIERQD